MDSKVRHKGVTQNTEESMVERYLTKRKQNGLELPNWYFRKPIPTDIRSEYGKTTSIRFSLGETDLKKAIKKAVSKYAALLDEFEEKRAEIEARKKRKKPDFSTHNQSATSESAKLRAFSSLSEREHRELILKKFYALERKYEALRNQEFRDEDGNLSDSLRDEALGQLATDLAVYSGTSRNYSPIDWEAEATGFLKEEGISTDSPPSLQALTNFASRLKNAHVEALWRTTEALEGRKFGERDPYFKGLSELTGETTPKTVTKASLSLKETAGKFLSYKKGLVTGKTLQGLTRACRIITDFYGEDFATSNVSTTKAEELTKFLATIPTGFKRNSPVNIKDFAKSAKKPPISAKSQHDLYSDIASMFEYACGYDFIDKNPFAKAFLKALLPKIEKRKKQLMKPTEIQRFFGYQSYLSEVDKCPAKFWVPLLCLFHGFRANEACQLFSSDLEEIEGIWCLKIEAGEDEHGNTKRLKNLSSKRIVPLHKEAIAVGFLKYAQQRQAKGEALLFDDLTVGKDGDKAQKICKWFSYHKNKVVDDEPLQRGDKGLHSFRHSFRDSLLNNGVEQSKREALGGWSSGGKSSEDEYGHGFSPQNLKEAIDKVSYEGLNLNSCKKAFEKISNA